MGIIRGDILYEGKAKRVYLTDHADLLIHDFKDDATAFNAQKRGTIVGKGRTNAAISAVLFSFLEKHGVPTHFRELAGPTQLVSLKLEMIPLEVVVRNIAAGSLAERLGYEEGTKLRRPIVELYYKSDELGDPLLTDDHILELRVADEEMIGQLRGLGLKINQLLREAFGACDLELVDFKLEFGLAGGVPVLADEISPDTCRLWDRKSGEKMDKDRFRRDLGRVEEAYQEVWERLSKAAPTLGIALDQVLARE